MSYTATGAFEPAIAALQKSAEISQRAPAPVALLGEAYAAAGEREQAKSILKELTSHRHVTKFFVSRIYAALGENEQALALLEAGYRERGEWIALISVDARFDPVRDHPRFRNLIRRMSFSE